MLKITKMGNFHNFYHVFQNNLHLSRNDSNRTSEVMSAQRSVVKIDDSWVIVLFKHFLPSLKSLELTSKLRSLGTLINT